MVKKLCIVIGGFLAILFVITTSKNTLLATGITNTSLTNVNVCNYGSVTGRIGDLKEGDNIRLGISREDGVDLGWLLLKNTHDKVWVTMSSISAGMTRPIGSNVSHSSWIYSNSMIKPKVEYLNNQLMSTHYEKNMIEERKWQDKYKGYESNFKEKYIFTPIYYEMAGTYYDELEINTKRAVWIPDPKYDAFDDLNIENAKDCYLLGDAWNFKDGVGYWTALQHSDAHVGGVTADWVSYVRPTAKWNLENIVFSASNEDVQSNCVNNVEIPTYDSSVGMTSVTGNMMNIRLRDTDLKVKLDDIVSKKSNGTVGTSARNFSIGDVFRLKYSGATIGTNNVVSMLVSNLDGDLVYYMQVGKAKAGSQYIDIDTTNWKMGTYQIQLVNEVLTESNSPSTSSELTTPITITINDDLSALDVVPTPDAADASKSFFESTVNANAGSPVAKITTKNGVAPIRYEIIDGKGTASHKAMFEIEKSSNGLPKIQSDGSVRIRATQNLTPGIYYFRVQAYDANNRPAPAIYADGSVVSEAGITKGIISDNVKIIVYPTGTNISHEAQFNDGKSFNVNDIQSKPSSVLGILGLEPSFNVAGVSVTYAIKDVKVNGVVTDDLEITDANAGLGKITGKSNIVEGEHTFTAVASFNDGTNTYQIELKNQKLTIAPSLYFTKTASDTTKITKVSMEFANVEADRIFTLYAKGDSRIEYRILPENISDGVVAIIGASEGSNTTGIFKMLKPGKTKVEAFVKEDGNVLSSAILSVEITQGELSDFTFTLDGTDLAIPEIVSTYAPNKQHQLGIKDAPNGSSVTWRLDADEQGMHNGIKIDDVIEINENTGELTILNANLRTQTDVKILATLSVPGYADKELDPILVTIEKAPQDKLKFAQAIYQMPNGTGSFTPRFKNGVESEDGSWNYILKCEDVRVSVNKDTFHYQVEDVNGATITIKAMNKGNRNYEQSEEITAILRILKPGETLPNVEVLPNRILTYGERISLHVRDSDPDAEYTFTSLDEHVLVQDEEHKNEFISKGVSDSVTIQITKTLAGFAESDEFITVQIKPKPIEAELKQAYVIKTGEAIPTFELKDFKAGDILQGDVLPQPILQASVSDSSKAGTYPITLRYPDELDAHKYAITLKKANLVIEQAYVGKEWVKAYPKDDETKTAIDPNRWYAQDIVVELVDTTHGYDQISETNTGNWSTTFTVSEEGDQQVEVYFRNSTTGSISDAVQIAMKIDKTAPTIPTISMQELHRSYVAQFLNRISFGTWMKKEVEVQMEAEDALSGLAYYMYREDDEEKTSESGTLRYGDETNLHLQAKACDVAGNCSSYSSLQQVMVDTKAPEIQGVKDKSTYKQYYIPRFVSVIDQASGVATAHYTKNKQTTIALHEDSVEKIFGEGEYVIYASDVAGNEVEISFIIIPLPDIETQIDGSDASKEIIEQVQKEFEEVKNQLTPEEVKDYEQWIEDALQTWENYRKKVIETEDKSAKVEGIGDTDFDPTVTLVIEKVEDTQDIRLPRKAKAIYDVFLKKGNTNIQPNGDIKVYLPYDEEVEPIVYQIDVDGSVKEIPAGKEGKYVSFITRKLLRYAISDVLQEDTTCKLNGVKLNMDTDKDGLPDLNLDITGTNHTVKQRYEPDCSADLNMDMNEDGIPDLNIDTTGDGKANINIDVNMDGKADINIFDFSKHTANGKPMAWKPDLQTMYDGFAYDTMEGILPEVNIDVNGDGKPDFNIDTDGDGIADTNLIDEEESDRRQEAMGGATTGDSTKWLYWCIALILSLTSLSYSMYREIRKRKTSVQ